jgi:hypothetical protein
MATPPVVDVITVTLDAADVAPAALAAAISTLQAAAAASHERVVGAVAADGAPSGTAAAHTHPPADPTFMCAPSSLAVGAARPLDVAATVGASARTAVGAPTWPSFDPSMRGAPYWSTPHAFFAAP